MDKTEKESVRLAMVAVISFGLISLFGDIIYEGARSIIPSYLELLAAPALIVGFAIGLGEFLGYALRLISGYVADTTRAYWTLTIVGYLLVVSIPLLAFTSNWQLAILLVITERIAKAIRTPARDTLLSVTTKGIGRGKAFGLHELLDQAGATLGPIIVAGSMYYASLQGSPRVDQIRFSFSILFIPYIILAIVLLSGYLKMNKPTKTALQDSKKERKEEKLTPTYYYYTFAVMLNTAGLFPIYLILYEATKFFNQILWLIPLLYLLVQGVDAVFAPISGTAYDKYGRKTLMIPFILSIFPTIIIASSMTPIPNLTLEPITAIISATIIFGIILGMQESIYRAAVADLTGISKRGLGYGIFSTAYGLGFVIAGTTIGYLLDLSLVNPNAMIYATIYTITLQALAITLLAKTIKETK
ncbi:MAG: MFS transporter [Candidatus Njordarchaeia archaeon]